MKATDKGIFLQRTAFSDSSLIVSFLTLEGGLRKFVFKGGKKKAHSLYPMGLAELTYYGRQESDLLQLTSADSIRPFQFPFHPVKGAIAFFMAETLRKCVAPGHPDKEFFRFAEAWVNRLEDRSDLVMLPLEFLVDCSDALGFRPLCESPEFRVFNLDSGEFQMVGSALERTMTGEAVEVLRTMVGEGSAPKVSRKVREEALEIMLEYFRIHVPRFDKLESYEIVREVLHA